MSDSTLPPRDHLLQIVRSLGRQLPAELTALLAHARFAEGAAALARLADDGHLSRAIGALADAEATWLVELFTSRWRLIGTPILDPIAAIVAPAEVWAGVEPIRIPVSVAVVGADPGWEVVWDGATPTTAGHAVVIVQPGVDGLTCRAHVRARTSAGRIALTAVAKIAVRRASVTLRDDRQAIVVTDQHGAPAERVTLSIGDTEHVTGAGGLVKLEQPAARGALMRVAGIPAGRIPDE